MKLRGTPRRSSGSALWMLFLLVAAASLVAVQDGSAPATQRAPGAKPELVTSLKLPVERTFDLDHVRPESFAAALGKDPERIFAFVRDAVAFESYRGALRGARGTLLALAGNATDRALLLASLLEASGQRVRFAQGTLPEPLAIELVGSMWAGHPTASHGDKGGATAGANGTPRVFETAVKYNYDLLRDQIRRAGISIGAEAATDVSALVREAQDHVWVEWQRGNEWIDLDPSFADAVVGKANAPVIKSWYALPDPLYHRIELSVVLEEQTGDKVSTRQVLQKTARACDLSGSDLLLTHQPESWSGPASSLEAALGMALGISGRIKPVLIIDGNKPAAGDSFYQRPPPAQTGGLGGVGNFGGGASRRRAVPIAIAERIQMSLLAPDGGRVELTRELFDMLGPARRLRNEPLKAAEVLTKVDAGDAFDATAAVYDLFVTTGRLAALHLKGVSAAETTGGDVAACLKRFGLSFAVASDALFEELRAKGICAYLDAPRVFIADASGLEKAPRLSLDLRHDRARVVTRDSTPEKAFNARLLRGVVDGVLERVLFEDLLAAGNEPKPAGEPEPQRALSTSLLFELAAQSAVPPRFVSSVDGLAALELESDARARLHDEIGKGYLALVPERAVRFSDRSRSAWWRIDAKTGDVVAVTDEGLHQVIVERRIIEDQKTREVTVLERTYIRERGGSRMFLGQKERTYTARQFLSWVDRVLAQEGSLGTMF